jgi:hypothetical protein
MSKKLFLTPLLFIFSFYILAQNDTLIKKKNPNKREFGIEFFYAKNLVSNPKIYPINQMLSIGYPDSIGDYKERLYQNALFCTNFYPGIIFNYYDKVGFKHSISISYLMKDKPKMWSIYYSDGSIKSINVNYQFSYSFFKKHRIYIYPFIAAKEDMTLKLLKDSRNSVIHPDAIFSIKDNSGLLLTQIPIGFSIELKYFTCSLSATMNLLAVMLGNYRFDPNFASIPGGYTHESFNYFKVQFVNRLIQEKYFFQNLRVSVGFKI